MSGHDKDDLSRFFRRASRKPEIEFNEDDWTKLEVMLDAESAKGASTGRLRTRTGLATVAVLSLVMLGGLWYAASTSNIFSSDNATTTKNSSGIKVPADISMSEKNNDQDLVTGNQNEDRKAVTALQARAESSLKTSPKKYISSKVEVQENVVNEKSIKTKTARSAAEHADEQINKQVVVRPSNRGSYSVVSGNRDGVTENRVSIDDGKNPLRPAVTSRVSSLSGDSAKTTPLTVDSLASKKEKAISKTDSASSGDKSSATASRWSILLSFSPDFSSVDLNRIIAPGEAFGIAIHYQVNPAFTIYAGLIDSHKKYQSYAADYKPAEDQYWSKHTNGIMPKEILGSCDMLEIPIGVQYTFAHMKKSKLYASAMLSSYIMYNESYQYSFDTPNPGAAHGWDAKKSSTYLLNVAGFAAGYERNLSNHIAMGVSPYIKIPLSTIGSWANIKLYTIGAAITVRYSLQKKKRPDPPILRSSSD